MACKREMSRLALPASIEGLGMLLTESSDMTLADELDGRVGGEGGAFSGNPRTLLLGIAACSHR